MNWPFVGIWRPIAAVAVLDIVLTTVLADYIRAPVSMMLCVVMLAFASGAATVAAIAFRARDRWLARMGLIRQ
jgi:hypothetical protein